MNSYIGNIIIHIQNINNTNRIKYYTYYLRHILVLDCFYEALDFDLVPTDPAGGNCKGVSTSFPLLIDFVPDDRNTTVSTHDK